MKTNGPSSCPDGSYPLGIDQDGNPVGCSAVVAGEVARGISREPSVVPGLLLALLLVGIVALAIFRGRRPAR